MMDLGCEEDGCGSPTSSSSPTTTTRRSSCLRSSSSEERKKKITRNVSFPEDDNQIVTDIFDCDPWNKVTSVTNEEILLKYVASCRNHGADPIPTVVEQIKKLDLRGDRNEKFCVRGVRLTCHACETLEEIFKCVQFEQVDLEATNLDEEASVILFDMLEYYESATSINISSNSKIACRGWQACSRYIRRSHCLESLEARNVPLDGFSSPALSRALKLDSFLTMLKLDNCNLGGQWLIPLATALKQNTRLTDLHLAENGLSVADALQLASMLGENNSLKLLDISHNDIKDEGFTYVVAAVAEKGESLRVLMVWNNNLTSKISKAVSKLLEEQTSLETLNVGRNRLGDDFTREIKNQLMFNRNLLRLGMQCTSMTNVSANMIADIIGTNDVIQRIDLRSNDLCGDGLRRICANLATNTSLIAVDLDKTPRNGKMRPEEVEAYKEALDKIEERCRDNERRILDLKVAEEEEDRVNELALRSRILKSSVVDCRKISLTCQSLAASFQPPQQHHFSGEPKERLRSPAPSPTPSPLASPAPGRNRFRVVKVEDGMTVNESATSGKDATTRMEGQEKEKRHGKVKVIKSELPEKGREGMKERMRKLSFGGFPPLNLTPDTGKISANLDKLIGLFQNPFNQKKDVKEEGKEAMKGAKVDTKVEKGPDSLRLRRKMVEEVSISIKEASPISEEVNEVAADVDGKVAADVYNKVATDADSKVTANVDKAQKRKEESEESEEDMDLENGGVEKVDWSKSREWNPEAFMSSGERKAKRTLNMREEQKAPFKKEGSVDYEYMFKTMYGLCPDKPVEKKPVTPKMPKIEDPYVSSLVQTPSLSTLRMVDLEKLRKMSARADLKEYFAQKPPKKTPTDKLRHNKLLPKIAENWDAEFVDDMFPRTWPQKTSVDVAILCTYAQSMSTPNLVEATQ